MTESSNGMAGAGGAHRGSRETMVWSDLGIEKKNCFLHDFFHDECAC